MKGRIVDLTLVDLWLRARRYRPAVVTIALTLAALRVLPGGEVEADAEDHPASVPIAAPAAPEPADGDAAVDGLPSGAPLAVPSLALPSPQPAPETPPAGASPPGSRAVPSHADGDGDAPSVAGREQATAAVRHTGWASFGAGTPLASIGVPDGALPVGNRVGRLDKASFLRLDGVWSALHLDVDAQGSSRGLAEIALTACAITTFEWSPGGERSFDDAPEWSTDCIDGIERDGTWIFPVAAIDHEHGVALVPADDAPLDFQIALVDPRPAAG